ncbi:MAG TPA: hypothetical protein VG755_27175 [Nannocystaceae bacterium]|nr:hypothetical protein [Nannocystaceae bacterium]
MLVVASSVLDDVTDVVVVSETGLGELQPTPTIASTQRRTSPL